MLKVGGGRAARKLSASLIAVMTGVVVTAFAVPVSAAATGGPYGGFATGEVAHAHALEVQGTKIANVELGQSNAAVASEGFSSAAGSIPAKTPIYNEFERPIVPNGFNGKNAYGQGSIVGVGLGVGPNDPNQIEPFVSQASTHDGSASDPKDNIHVNQANPLFWLDALHTEAIANWNPDTCIIGEPISAGFSRVAAADAVNLDPAQGTNADDSFKQALLSAHAVESTSFEQLVPGSGSGLGLASVAATRAVHIALFKGTANEIDINVAPAFLIVKVDGVHHSNIRDNIIYDAPIVTIDAQGTEVARLLPSQVGPVNVRIPQTGGDILLQLKLNLLEALTSSSGPTVTNNVNADGTKASASVNVLDLSVLKVPEVPFELAHLSIGHLEAAAQVPAGGISCPIPVTKTADPTTVQVGHNFTTTIKVDNPFACPLVLSKVTDDITTEGDSTFQILSATPDPQIPDSLPTAAGLTSGNVEWNKNLPTIPSGGSATFTVTLKAGGGAGKIKDTATAFGAVTNCKPAPGSSETEVTGITNVRVPVTGVGTLVEPETEVQGITKLPRTGLADSAYTYAGMLMLLAALGGGVVLRRRKVKIEA
jgi:LPXTG-motif cell wall-anchored protein